MSGCRLVAEGLRLTVGRRLLLDGVDLVLEPGTMIGVVGPSGSGKTSLLLVLAGVLTPDAGKVRFVLTEGNGQVAGRTIGFVPQTIGLAANLTAAENVALPLQVRGLARAEMRERTVGALQAVGLGAATDRLVTELSGGQRQRVAVARALAQQPDVLVADEATAELDGEHQAVVMDLLEAEQERGAAIVVATHDEVVAERCSQLYRLEQGHLEQQAGEGRESGATR